MDENQRWGVAGKPGDTAASKQPLWRNWRDMSAVTICIALSVLCMGVCSVVCVRSSELQSRIVSLEQQQRGAWMLSLEQVEPVILGRLDQILDEKLAARLPKTREAREAPHSCLCPPVQLEMGGLRSHQLISMWPLHNIAAVSQHFYD
ncbi:collagen alpha-1(XIII) chain-like [Sander vitreus]